LVDTRQGGDPCGKESSGMPKKITKRVRVQKSVWQRAKIAQLDRAQKEENERKRVRIANVTCLS
jgi:hypothetical protein